MRSLLLSLDLNASIHAFRDIDLLICVSINKRIDSFWIINTKTFSAFDYVKAYHDVKYKLRIFVLCKMSSVYTETRKLISHGIATHQSLLRYSNGNKPL